MEGKTIDLYLFNVVASKILSCKNGFAEIN
jgi:hypothetical protein